MLSSRLAFAGLAAACVAAAGGGGYLASRQNVAPTPVQATPAPAADAEPQTPALQPVQETEAVIASEPVKPGPALEPVERPAAPRRSAAARPSPRTQKPPTRQTPPADPPALDRSWPSTAASSAAAPAQQAAADPFPVVPQIEERTPEPSVAPEPAQRQFEELVVSANSVVGLQMDTAISSERAGIEDRVEARVVRDVRSGGGVAIPAGSRALGSVMVVERGGKFKERARLGIRFHTLVLADGTRLPITTETIYRYGEAPGNSSAAKIGGGAVAGAILGAIVGGAKGAAVGATAGAGGGTAAVMAGDRSAATFPAGAEVTARLISPVTVTVEK